MGQKTNPKVLRLGITEESDSNWYDHKNYDKKVLEDFNIRAFLMSELSRAGVSKIKILRKSDQLEVKVVVARPGLIFGKASIDLGVVKAELSKIIKRDVIITIVENKSPDTTAPLVAEWICGQIEKRIPFRRAMKMAMQRSLKAGVDGVKIACSGRLGGIEIARTEWFKEGKIPLHTFRAVIDYAFDEALTTYGKIGVKVWLYKGENIKEELVEGNDVKSKKNKV